MYRLYNSNAGDHHYTLNSYERDMLVSKGWRYEGIGWYSSDTNRSYPLYRQYNPNAKAGAHNYTLNSNEKDMLVRAVGMMKDWPGMVSVQVKERRLRNISAHPVACTRT